MDVAGIITAVATLVTAVGGVILAFTVLLPLLRKTRATNEIVSEVHAKTDHVVELVNSNHEAMLRREQVLIAALQKAGVVIPPNEAIALKE